METTYLSGWKEIRSTRAVVSNDSSCMTFTGKALGPNDKSEWVMAFRKQLASKPCGALLSELDHSPKWRVIRPKVQLLGDHL
jgi:hypothetical protein